MVITRSPLGIKLASTFNKVVFPDPVPPEMIIFFFAATQSFKKSAMSLSRLRKLTRSSISILFSGNLRIVMVGPLIARGGIMAFTRDPSFNRASTIGELSSILRPKGVTIRSITSKIALLLVNSKSLFTIFPDCSIKISSLAFTIISVTCGLLSSSSSGPNPIASLIIFCFNRSIFKTCGRSPSTSNRT